MLIEPSVKQTKFACTIDTDQSVGDGESLIVYGIILKNDDNRLGGVLILDSETGSLDDTIFQLNASPFSCFALYTPFTITKGLRVAGLAGSELTITIFHSHGGA